MKRRPEKPKLARLGRGLTLLRLPATLAFAWALLRLESAPPAPGWRVLLIASYAYAVLSDLLDGPLARRAGARSYFWGQVDAFSDIAFNAVALAAAAWAGRLGPWAPLGVLALGARFLWRCRRARADGSPPDGSLPEDAAGRRAGVFFYVLTGVVVFDTTFPLAWLGAILPRLGELAFLYALYALLRGWLAPRRRFSRPASRRTNPNTPSG